MNPHLPNTPVAHPLARAFLLNRHLLVLCAVVILVGGLAAFCSLPRLEDPIITNRNPQIITLFPGASADRVESLVTEPIEQALKEVSAIKHVDSTSRAGVSVIAIELADEVTEESNDALFSEIRDRLADAAARFPAEVRPPLFDDKRNAVAFTLIAAIAWSDGSEDRLGILRRHAEELADRLRGVPGTELVRLYGEPAEEIEVTLRSGEVEALGLTADAVAAALRSADAKVPAGVLRGGEADLLVELTGEFNSLERVRQVPLSTLANGREVRLGDLAAVQRAVHEPVSQIALANGRRAMLVAARVQADRRVDEWSVSARQVIERFSQEAGGGLAVTTVFDQDTYTSARLGELGGNLVLGAVVVLAVLLLTMGWRSAWIVGLALPLTGALTLFVVALMGGALHQMSIFGMIIALGLLIDNAIVMTDEVRKNLRAGLTPLGSVSAAIRHLLVPLLSSTVTTMLSFLPILLLPGGAGDFVSSIGISVIIALAGSFVVAVTIIAALAGWFGRSRTAGVESRGPRWLREGVGGEWFSRTTRRWLEGAMRRPGLTIALSLIIPAVGFILGGTLGSQFFPRTDRNMFEVEVWLPTGSSIDRTRKVVGGMERILRERHTVTAVDWVVGSSFPSVYYNLIMNQDGSPHYAHGIVTARDFEAVAGMVDDLQREFDACFPEAQIVVSKFAQGPPAAADVEIRVYGPGIETLQDLGENVRRRLAEHPGILHSQVTMPRGEPKLWVNAREDEVRQTGLRLTDMAGQLQGAMEGAVGGTILEGIEAMPVRVRFDRGQRDEAADIASARLVTPAAPGSWVPVSAVGNLELRPELGGITRRDGARVNKVLGFARAGTLPIEIANEVIRQLKHDGLVLPAGYQLELGGETESQSQAVGNLLLYLPVLTVLTVAVLVLSFRSARIAVILLLVAPFSAGFGLLATWAMQFPLSFNTVIGSLGLMGLAFNSSIIVLAAIRADARAVAGDPVAMTDVMLGSSRHLISTTLTTMGSFLPLLLLVGGQFWPPLAIVLAGGVGGSTLLAVTFAPALYRVLMCRRSQEQDRVSPAIQADLAVA